MSASVVVCILAAIFLCTIHLFLGFVLGQRKGSKEPVACVDEAVVLPQLSSSPLSCGNASSMSRAWLIKPEP